MKYRVRASLFFLIGILVASDPIANAQHTVLTRQVSIVLELAPVDLAYGQSLRISVFNPSAQSPRNDGRRFKMLVAPLILDASGNAVAQADDHSRIQREKL